MIMAIDIAKPLLGDGEKREISEVFGSTQITNGPMVRKFEKEFASYVGTKHAVACNNGTAALHAALLALGIRPGDEVITTAFSFIASANCITYCGAKPVFADIDPKTYNLNPEKIEEKITNKTKAILPVHLYGLTAEMGGIMEIAEKHGLPVLEDACQSHGAEYRGKKVGSIGDAGCFSFYPTKNMTTGEGGMVTTDDDGVAERCRIVINQGMKERYKHEVLGFNYRMTDFSGAVGLAQLKKLEEFNAARIRNAKFYDKNLSDKYAKPHVPENCRHVYNQYTIRAKDRDRVAKRLEENKIGYGIYYPRMIPQQPIYGMSERFPEAEKACAEVLSIPVHPALSQADLETVVKVLEAI